MKEVVTISLFSLAAVILSLLLSDLLFFPLSYYAMRNVDIFNILFRYITVLSIIIVLVAILYFKIRSRYRDGYTATAIIRYVILRPFQYAGFVIFTLGLVALIIAIIYMLFNINYYQLHRISGGI